MIGLLMLLILFLPKETKQSAFSRRKSQVYMTYMVAAECLFMTFARQ